MRIAVLILTLIVGAILFVQTFLVTALGGAIGDESTAGAGAVGMLVALLWLIAAAFVIGVPLISVIAFVIAAVLAFAMAASSDFSDLTIWGVASLVLAALSLIGFVTKRRGARVEERKQRERDARLAASIRESASTTYLQPIAAPPATCSQCGSMISPSSRFCQDCGAPRSQYGDSTLPATNR